MGNCYLIIIDGLGVGAQEDAHLYGDEAPTHWVMYQEKLWFSFQIFQN